MARPAQRSRAGLFLYVSRYLVLLVLLFLPPLISWPSPQFSTFAQISLSSPNFCCNTFLTFSFPVFCPISNFVVFCWGPFPSLLILNLNQTSLPLRFLLLPHPLTGLLLGRRRQRQMDEGGTRSPTTPPPPRYQRIHLRVYIPRVCPSTPRSLSCSSSSAWCIPHGAFLLLPPHRHPHLTFLWSLLLRFYSIHHYHPTTWPLDIESLCCSLSLCLSSD
jgi:hypothetical protein